MSTVFPPPPAAGSVTLDTDGSVDYGEVRLHRIRDVEVELSYMLRALVRDQDAGIHAAVRPAVALEGSDRTKPLRATSVTWATGAS